MSRLFGTANRASHGPVQVLNGEPRLHGSRGRALLALRDLQGARRELEKGVSIDPACAETRATLAVAYLETGDLQRSLDECTKVLEQVPRHEGALLTLARVHRASGSFALARETLLLAPDSADALLMLADMGCHDLPSLSDAALIERLAAPTLRADHRRDLLFALGRVQEHRESYERAFRSYEQGNAIQRKLAEANGFRYRPEEWNAQVDGTIRAWTPEYTSHLAARGDPSEVPVFIVGLPRSGTTLVEQMLSAHPLVHGAGERPEMLETAFAFAKAAEMPDGTFSRHVPAGLLRSFAARYLEKLRVNAGHAIRVIDKNPHNFEQVGLISALFPKARIIHCRRDAYDTCASIYTQPFHVSHTYATDLQSLAHYYRGYRRLMDHWRGLCEVQYENLVSDPEAECRRLLQYIGLEWDAACLAPERNARPVLTPTASQIRRPLNRDALGRWRRFEAPLLTGLGDLGATS